MKRLDGMDINRDSQYGVVDQIPKQFRESQQFVNLITPSGPRKKRDYWKFCFYWIAYTEKVPILFGFLDYIRKEVCLSLSFVLTFAVRNDMNRICEFSEDIQSKHPELAIKIKILDENI